MRIKNIIPVIFALFLITSCYKDLGNYTYHEVNEINISGINDLYAIDMGDTLQISPELQGTQYSDTSRFTYQWEVSNRIYSSKLNLFLPMTLSSGQKLARFVVKDKATGVKSFRKFSINVSSTTAGDLLMVLSRSKGVAELSYLRLDKESQFVTNYFQSRYFKSLGTEPTQLSIIYCQSGRDYPLTSLYGRIFVICKEGARIIEKNTLAPDTIKPYLSGEVYTAKNPPYPLPDIEGYKSEFINEGISAWRFVYNSNQQQTYVNQISGGTLYFATPAPGVWTPYYKFKQQSPYTKGYLSPFCFYEKMVPMARGTIFNMGYELGSLVLFDRVNGRFTYSSYGTLSPIAEADLKSFPGADLIYGSPTVNAPTCFAVLNQGGVCKLLLLNMIGAKSSLLAEILSGPSINATTKFYTMKNAPYVYYVTGNKLYRYNFLDMRNGIPPSDANVVASLSDFGYDATAIITDICVSRTERTLILGVSRYGDDTDAMSDENKGDLLLFDFNASTLVLQFRKKYEGISGYPVDVQIKYQTFMRDGIAFPNEGVVVDKI